VRDDVADEVAQAHEHVPTVPPVVVPRWVQLVVLPLALHQNDGRASYIATDSGSLPFRLAQLVKQDVHGAPLPRAGAGARGPEQPGQTRVHAGRGVRGAAAAAGLRAQC